MPGITDEDKIEKDEKKRGGDKVYGELERKKL